MTGGGERTMVIEAVYDGGGEEIGLYSHGHHDPREFREAAVVCAPDLGLEVEIVAEMLATEVRHEWWRDELGTDGLDVMFRPAKEGEPGAYAVTCWPIDGHGVLVAPSSAAPPEGRQARGCAVLRALAFLLHQSYDVEALSDDDRDLWRAIVADARSEYDRLRSERDAAVQRAEEAEVVVDGLQREAEVQRGIADAAESSLARMRAALESAQGVMELARSSLDNGGGTGHESVRLEEGAKRIGAILAGDEKGGGR